MVKKSNIKIIGLKNFITKLRKSKQSIDKQLNVSIIKSALIIAQDVKDKTPVKSGALKKGIYPEFGNMSAVIRPHNAPYAYWVHEGTKAHIIRPKSKKALSWKGARHPVKLVRHPGTKGKKFMDEGLEVATPKVEAIFGKDINKVLIKLTR